MSLFAVKPLETILADSEKETLKRTLGPGQLVALGIGAIIGAGLFSLTGIAASQHAGPAVVLSFILSAIGCAFAGICYSEFATMSPIAGSAYTYSYATMGELVAWIIGWDRRRQHFGFGSASSRSSRDLMANSGYSNV